MLDGDLPLSRFNPELTQTDLSKKSTGLFRSFALEYCLAGVEFQDFSFFKKKNLTSICAKR